MFPICKKFFIICIKLFSRRGPVPYVYTEKPVPFDVGRYIEEHRDEIIVGRKTAEQLMAHVLQTLPAESAPLASFDAGIVNAFLTGNPFVKAEDTSMCRIILLRENDRYTSDAPILKNVYLLINLKNGKFTSNNCDLFTDLYLWRGISERDLDERNTECLAYVSYLKLKNEAE